MKFLSFAVEQEVSRGWTHCESEENKPGEFLEYTVEDRSDPTLKGIDRLWGMMTRIFTGGRPDLNYHGWLYLSCFGRAKFTDGTLVAFEPEHNPPIDPPQLDAVSERDG